MDPDFLYEYMKSLSAKIAGDYENEDGNGVDQDEANEMAMSFQAMDNWIRNGGAKPKAWK